MLMKYPTLMMNMVSFLKTVSDARYAGIFNIDDYTAVLSLQKSFGEILNGSGITDDFSVVLTIQVR